MATDRNNHFIVTADVEGFVKVWEIQDYALSITDQPITNPPSMRAHFRPHQDQINSLEICERNERVLIISASSDCSVAVLDIDGNSIGIFGQEEHWKIDPCMSSLEMKNKEIQKKAELIRATSVMKTNEDLHWQPDETAIHEPKSYRINSWNKTVLGRDYQKRILKRERKQPGTISDMPLLHTEKVDLFAGPYSALMTQELTPIQSLVRPDTDKYFSYRSESGKFAHTKLPALAESESYESLITAFDEKSMFPSYILDFEKRMKNYHIALLNQSQVKGKSELPGIQNLGTQIGQTDKMKPVFTLKRTSSKGYLRLKQDPLPRIRNNSTSTVATSTAD